MPHRPAIAVALVCCLATGALLAGRAKAGAGPSPSAPEEIHVDPRKGRDSSPGSRGRPLKTISAALARLPDPLHESVTIRLAAGTYDSTGGQGMPERTLELMVRMRPGVSVRLAGPEEGEPAILAWRGERNMIDLREGSWRLSHLQIGSFSTSQRRGLTATGPGRAHLEDVRFRLRSHSDAGIWATAAGRVSLRGAIELNEHLHEEAEEETFCGILATDGGVVEFDQREGSSLSLGNGNLSVRSYGSIRLGCEKARITCWTKSTNIAVNNGGRIDLRNTPTVLRAHLESNTPLGLEHDGHVLAEDAKITFQGSNHSAIALQKASTFTCNDIALEGEFGHALWASSGSMFVGRFLGDVPKVEARTGASVHIEKVGGRFVGPAVARSGGLISLPDRTVRSD